MISIFADGSSSSGGPSKAIGWGWVVVDGNRILASGFGGYRHGTNNQAELMGLIDGLRAVARNPEWKSQDLELVSDSQYALGMASGRYSPKENVELANYLRELAAKTGAQTRWVRGHSGDLYNEICDRLAQYGKEQYGGAPKKKRIGNRQRKRARQRRMKALTQNQEDGKQKT